MPGGLETTPRDELTGLPLPVLMTSTDFFINDGPRDANYHHHLHPRRSQELGYSTDGTKLPKDDPSRVGGFALRYCRGQQVPVWLHERYHDIFYGPELPQDSRGKFTAVVLACAGVVPREAISLYTAGEYKLKPLDDKQYEFIRRRVFFEGAASVTKRSKRSQIGKFLAEYALQAPLLDAMTEQEVKKRVNEFLRPKSESQRAEAGRFILEHAIGASVADLIPIHEEAIKEKMVKSHRGLAQTVIKFFSIDRFADYYNPLEERLAAIG